MVVAGEGYRPCGLLHQRQVDAACAQCPPRRRRLFRAVKSQERERLAPEGGAERADGEFAVEDWRPRRWRGARQFHARDAFAGRPAVLHARNNLLADVAALVEIDPMEEVEIGVVWEGVRIGEIQAALRRSDGDTETLVFVDVLRSEGGGGRPRQDRAPA